VGVVTSLLVDLGYAFAAASPGRVCLHAGAVELGGRLVVFPSASKAGKSTLIAALAMAGRRIFADDLLPIEGEPATAVALGTFPRLRLPLGRAGGEAFRAFVATHAGPADDDNQFLRLPPALHAKHGETAPIGAFVLLERQRDGRATIEPAAAGEGLRRVILQNLATPATADTVFARLRSLIEGYPCFTLRYSRLEEAVALLEERFAEWAPTERPPSPGSPAAEIRDRKDGIPSSTLRSAGDDTPVVPGEPQGGGGRGPGRPAARPTAPDPAVPSPAARGNPPSPSLANSGRLVQSPDATLHDVDGSAFLVHPGTDGIYALDQVALLVWKLLAEPAGGDEIVAVLAEIFPDEPPARIRRDVTRLLRDLDRRGLARPEDGHAAKKGAPKRRPDQKVQGTGQTE
jgi:hypothetical protein